MKNNSIIINFTVLLFLLPILAFAQNKIDKEKTNSNFTKTESINSVDAIGDMINFKNSTGNSIITFTDEGSNSGNITPPLSYPNASNTNNFLNLSRSLNINNTIKSIGTNKINGFDRLPLTTINSSQVDSVIGTFADGQKFKEIYSFNSPGKKTITIKQTWTSNNWVNSTRETNNYNDNLNRILFLRENWDVDHWVGDIRYNYSFDSNSNYLSFLYEVWDGTEWQLSSRGNSIYDTNNLRTSFTAENWELDHWVNDRRYLYDYDSQGNINSQINQNWSNDAWVNTSWVHTSYNVANFKTFYQWQLWNDSSWTNHIEESYTYDSNNNLLSILNKFWNGVAMVNNLHFSYEYNSEGNQTQELIKYWVNNEWVNSSILKFAYNGSGNLINKLNQIWNINQWEDNKRTTYEYDSNDYLRHIQNEKSDSLSWVPNDDPISFEDSFENNYGYFAAELYVYFKNLTYTKNDTPIKNKFFLYQNYPNPFNPSTVIKYQIPKESIVTLKVFDVLGEEVEILVDETKNAGIYSLEWNSKNLSTGIYFYKLTSGNFTRVMKMLLIK